MHERNILHLDIKPQNILLHRTDCNLDCKIADFGSLPGPYTCLQFDIWVSDWPLGSRQGSALSPLVITVAGLSQAISPNMATIDTLRQGTVMYAPWEMAMQQKSSPKADVYALALIIGEALTGRLFYEGMTLAQALTAVMYHGLRPKLPHWVPRELKALLRQAWSGKRALRPSIQDFVTRLEKIQLKLVAASEHGPVGHLGTPVCRGAKDIAGQGHVVSAV